MISYHKIHTYEVMFRWEKKHALLQEQDCFTSILILQVYLVS
jgi:hypothetical protein